MSAHEPPVSSGIPAVFTGIHPDRHTMPFWEAAAEHRLVAPRCVQCATFRMPPGPFCWKCQACDVDWVELSGRGTVHTFTVARQALVPALAAAVPYAIALVDVDDAAGIRLVLAVVDAAPEAVEVGAQVTVVWEDYDGRTIPRARLSGPSAQSCR